MHHLRGADEAAGGVRAGEPGRRQVPHLEARHLPAIRELHHAPHHPQHNPPHVQGQAERRYTLLVDILSEDTFKAFKYFTFNARKNCIVRVSSLRSLNPFVQKQMMQTKT